MNITVIGLGLIGGSFSKGLKSLTDHLYFIGSDVNKANEKRALELGLVDEVLPEEQAVQKAAIILLAIPVDVLEKKLVELLDQIKPNQLIIDFGSTKHHLALAVKSHPNRAQYLAAHPMAGTENTGPDAALLDLYKEKVLIICDKEFTLPSLAEKAIALFKTLQMNIIDMNSEEHDKHIAYVSHLSHVSSFMLGLTVLEIEKDEKNIFNMAGSGFLSTVRLAMSSPDMWTPIFLQNNENVTKALDEYILQLQTFRKILEEKNGDQLHQLMKDANKIKRALGRKN